MNTILMFIFLGILGYIIANIFYKIWFNSKLVVVKDRIKSDKVKDYIIFEYTLGGYMEMVNLSIPILTINYEIYGGNSRIVWSDGYVEEVKNRIFYIGYEVEVNSGKFFIYAYMKAKDRELRFSTYLGENPCRFIVFTDESNLAFIPDNKNIEILEFSENVDYVFEAMPWQKWENKKFSKIRIDNNKLIPYEKVEKEVHHYIDYIGNADYEGANMPSPLP